MKFVKDDFSSSIEEKKSKFISYLTPYSNFNHKLEQLRKEHPKARHFVYAYRYLNEYEQVVENCSDDGEPRGTSGKPTLAVLSGANIINTAVIIVRYFGGIKLGTGGLVRAYSDSVNAVIDNAIFYPYKKMITKNFKCDYNNFSKVEYLLNQNSIHIKDKIFTEEITIFLELSDEDWKSIEVDLNNILNNY